MTKEENLKKQIAKKYGINLAQVKEIVSCQDKFVADVIGKKSDRDTLYFPSIRLPGFGIFYCPDYKKKIFTKLKEENEALSDR